jgi:hypothetical protein
MTVAGEILAFLATILLLILTDAFILWDIQDALRIAFAIGVNFAMLYGYSVIHESMDFAGANAGVDDHALSRA